MSVLFHDWILTKFIFTYNISWEINSKHQILELIKRRSRAQEKNVSCEHALNFVQWKTNDSLNMACLQIYRECLLLATFLRVHWKSKEVSYLSWQNMYPNFEATYYIKLKFFLLTKLVENLLFAKYLISVTALVTNFVFEKSSHRSFRIEILAQRPIMKFLSIFIPYIFCIVTCMKLHYNVIM